MLTSNSGISDPWVSDIAHLSTEVRLAILRRRIEQLMRVQSQRRDLKLHWEAHSHAPGSTALTDKDFDVQLDSRPFSHPKGHFPAQVDVVAGVASHEAGHIQLAQVRDFDLYQDDGELANLVEDIWIERESAWTPYIKKSRGYYTPPAVQRAANSAVNILNAWFVAAVYPDEVAQPFWELLSDEEREWAKKMTQLTPVIREQLGLSKKSYRAVLTAVKQVVAAFSDDPLRGFELLASTGACPTLTPQQPQEIINRPLPQSVLAAADQRAERNVEAITVSIPGRADETLLIEDDVAEVSVEPLPPLALTADWQQAPVRVVPLQPVGRLSRRTLSRLPWSEKVFEQLEDDEATSAVGVLLDRSSSISSLTWQLEQQIAEALVREFTASAVISYCGDGNVTTLVAHKRVDWPTTRWSRAAKPKGGTPTAPALLALRHLLPEMKSDGVVVHVTDGEPDDPRTAEAALRKLTSEGWRVVTLFVGDAVYDSRRYWAEVTPSRQALNEQEAVKALQSLLGRK